MQVASKALLAMCVYVPLKRLLTFEGLHGVVPHNHSRTNTTVF
jgi:hypothetical protein